MNTLTIIFILTVGVIIWLVFSFFKKPKGINYENVPEQIKLKEKNKEKILEYLKHNEKIVNNDVEKLVGVSDATAERYLNEIEKEGKIKQIGKTGHYVYYQLK
jgi:predicted HTH transcriptional regulator